jgi:hypothetical protein
MSILKLLSFFLISVCFGLQAHAIGLYLEPGVFYEGGNNDVQWPSPLQSSTGTTKGFGADLKIGIHFDSVFFIAAEGSYSKVKFENSATNYSADATSTIYDGILGLQFPHFGLRGWAGYVFGGTLDPESSGSYDVKFDTPQGFKVGLGFKIAIVSINIEYMDIKYNNGHLDQPVATDFSDKLHNKVGMLSVSFPFTF